MENKHIVAVAGFGLLILLMVLLVFQSTKTPKMGEDLTGLNMGQNAQPTQPPVTELTGRDLNIGSSSAAVVAGDTVTLHYKGAFTDGKIFDDSYLKNSPITFQVGAGQIIKGVELGVVGMKIGGKRQIQIPADLAYGAAGQGSVIPPNTPLIFEIELIDLKTQPAPNPSPSAEVSGDPSITPAEGPTPAP